MFADIWFSLFIVQSAIGVFGLICARREARRPDPETYVARMERERAAYRAQLASI